MTSCLGLCMTENMADMQAQEEYTSAGGVFAILEDNRGVNLSWRVVVLFGTQRGKVLLVFFGEDGLGEGAYSFQENKPPHPCFNDARQPTTRVHKTTSPSSCSLRAERAFAGTPAPIPSTWQMLRSVVHTFMSSKFLGGKGACECPDPDCQQDKGRGLEEPLAFAEPGFSYGLVSVSMPSRRSDTRVRHGPVRRVFENPGFMMALSQIAWSGCRQV